MASKAEQLPRPLSHVELVALLRALELRLPEGAPVRAVWWPGRSEEQRNYRITTSTTRAAREACHRTWLIERRGNRYRLRARPADSYEIELLLEALREVAALAPGGAPALAEASYDCVEHTYQVCFTALDDMREGQPYERWILRRHPDGRPLSVGYVLETRTGRGYATLPGGARLRGNPWSD